MGVVRSSFGMGSVKIACFTWGPRSLAVLRSMCCDSMCCMRVFRHNLAHLPVHGFCDDFFCGKGLLFRSCIRRIWELLLEGALVGFGQQRVAAMACAASGACESGR